MSCDCFDLTNAALVEHNSRLGFCWSTNPKTGTLTTTVRIATEILEKKRGARPVLLMPSHCPFCGTQYEPEETDDATAPGHGPATASAGEGA